MTSGIAVMRYDLFARPLDTHRAMEQASGIDNRPARIRTAPDRIIVLPALGHPLLECKPVADDCACQTVAPSGQGVAWECIDKDEQLWR